MAGRIDPGAVSEDVQRTEALHDGRHAVLPALLVRDIEAHERASPPIPAATFRPPASSTSASTTRAPARASRLAIAALMPEAAPVTNATRPRSCCCSAMFSPSMCQDDPMPRESRPSILQDRSRAKISRRTSADPRAVSSAPCQRRTMMRVVGTGTGAADRNAADEATARALPVEVAAAEGPTRTTRDGGMVPVEK